MRGNTYRQPLELTHEILSVGQAIEDLRVALPIVRIRGDMQATEIGWAKLDHEVRGAAIGEGRMWFPSLGKHPDKPGKHS